MLLDKVKLSIRFDENWLDEDIQDSIAAAIADLKLSGIKASKITEADPLILKAIKAYCKSDFSDDENEAKRYKESYDMLKTHLTLSSEYVDVITS
ncbi:MAG: head-tail connector protein [Bacteroidota bacterium]|nr:head-tail connector protein [Bacteroidota bacterium]